MIKRYLIVIVSFVVTCISFYFLMNVQQNINDKKELVEAYFAKENIDIYEKLTEDKLQKIFIEKSNVDVYKISKKIDKDMLSNSYISKGEIILDSMIISNSNSIKRDENRVLESVAIKFKNIENCAGNILNDNGFVNVYIKVQKKYVPEQFLSPEYILMEENEYVTFLYFEKIRPIKLLNKEGKQKNENDTLEFLILDVERKDAIYINSIRDIAEFYMSVV